MFFRIAFVVTLIVILFVAAVGVYPAVRGDRRLDFLSSGAIVAALYERRNTLRRSETAATTSGGQRPPLQPPAVIDRRYKMKPKYKPRLQRLKWLFTDCPVYFITVCTQPRRSILAKNEMHDSFKKFAVIATEYNVFVGRYVLMPDHAHFFAAFSPKSPSLSKWMKSWKNALSKTLRHMGIRAQHWEKDFFDHVMRSAESYEVKWEYVRQNPVRAGLVQRPEEWPYQGEINRLLVL